MLNLDCAGGEEGQAEGKGEGAQEAGGRAEEEGAGGGGCCC